MPFKMGRNKDYWINQHNYLFLKMVNTCLYQIFHFSSISELEGFRVGSISRPNKAMILLKDNLANRLNSCNPLKLQEANLDKNEEKIESIFSQQELLKNEFQLEIWINLNLKN